VLGICQYDSLQVEPFILFLDGLGMGILLILWMLLSKFVFVLWIEKSDHVCRTAF
jgi:hypothetical protein